MALLATNNIVDAGTKPVTSVPTASDTAAIGSGTSVFVVYRNTSATPFNVTVATPGNTSYGVALPAETIAVVANTGEVWVPLRKVHDPGTGLATLTTSAQPAGATVTVVSGIWTA